MNHVRFAPWRRQCETVAQILGLHKNHQRAVVEFSLFYIFPSCCYASFF